MSPRLTRFRRSIASLVLAFTVLAGLAAVAYGLAGSGVGSSRATSGGTAPRVPGRSARLSLQVLGSHQSVTAGGLVRYRMRIVRMCRPVRLCGRLNQFRAVRVWLGVVRPVPVGLMVRFTRSVTRAHTTTLVLSTRSTVRSGNYRVQLRAGTSRHAGRGHTASSVVTFTVNAGSGLALGLAGSPVRVLVPGGVAGIDLALTDRQRANIVVSSVVVSIKQVQAPRADAAHPCTPADFAVSQLSGPYRLALAPSNTQTLGQLGIDPSRWPSVTMLDRPVNQDGCEGASVVLAYSGTATG